LDPEKSYTVVDYVHNKSLGTVREEAPWILVDFNNALLLEVRQLP
jgi:hypothetical protein